MHPNNSFDIQLTDKHLHVLSQFEVIQVSHNIPVYLFLLKMGEATVVVAKSSHSRASYLYWANGRGYEYLGIPEINQPSAKA